MTVFRRHPRTWAELCLSLGGVCARLALALLTATCTSTIGHSEVTTLTHVEAGVYSSLASRTFLVIESAEDFARWYQDLHAHRLPPPAVPRIDFRQHLAVAVSMGHRPTGGYAIRITDAALDGDTINVTILERQPAPGTAQITVVTNPYAIATVARGYFTKLAFIGAEGQVLAVRQVAPPSRG